MEELAGIIILGIFAQWFAWRVKVPAILPLIVIGLLVGPLSTLLTADGSKLISPIFTMVGDTDEGRGLFPGESLFYFVSLAIGIILFEGGLTLQFREVRETQRSILRLISIGSLVTFIGAGLAAQFIMNLGWSVSFLFAALIIVTGPTVIAPILQNIPLNRNVSTVLKWEGILIDPLGALVAVLVFEFISSTDHGLGFTGEAVRTFVQIIIYGGTLGFLAGYALFQIIKREMVPHYLLNVFILAYVLFIFVVSDQLAHESGLLAVVVMGLVLANKDVPRIKEILSFKESISVLLISILFILLAANMNMSELRLLTEDWRPLALFGVVILVLRPLAVFASTARGNLSFNEKLFISWVGPRGIVAAGIASLFGLKLAADGVPGAEYITPLVFMIVLGTVLINATTARFVARMLKVIQDTSSGVLILGANDFAITIAEYLKSEGREVFLVDSNSSNIRRAQEKGLRAIVSNIYNSDLSDEYDLLDVGYMLALTGSDDVNAYAISRYEDIFGERGAYRLITAEEMKAKEAPEDAEHIFSRTDDFINFSEAHREAAMVHEQKLFGQQHFLDLLLRLERENYSVPLFVKAPDGTLQVLSAHPEEIDVSSGEYCLVYLGIELPEAARPKELTEERGEL
ncbi:NhaP-type Na+/H+ or K+/H+ antiporter [Lewinella aquimaris]|uniref:NhaP-type Na+/H+ or K+/H+ antiporter n=1 Tax=Neolewinella aquimaris TaxID=1835722 RepID=A0A840ED55_9BACT|nr:sodium:proton antiporter [Neolewinella aquimaris]MBB4078876.1 NhaP-type Na+/H+ or K+/H+ antiporter [Neolewinella aquimaris]